MLYFEIEKIQIYLLFESFNVLILISCGRLLLTYSIFLVLYKHLIFFLWLYQFMLLIVKMKL